MSKNWNPAGAPTWCRLNGDLPQMNGNVVVMVDDSPDRVSSLFETEIPSLPDNLEVRLLQIPIHDGEDHGIVLTMLRDTLASLIPEIGPEFAAMAPGRWIEAIKEQRSRGTTNDRWIIVDRFHLVFEFPSLERNILAEILQQLAEIPSFGVIVGITTESAVQMAALLNLIESKDTSGKETTPLPSAATEEFAQKKTAGMWTKVGVAAIIIGLGTAAFFGVPKYINGSKEPEVVVFGAQSATEDATTAETGRAASSALDPAEVKQIETAGHINAIPQIEVLRPVFDADSLNSAHQGGEPKFIPGDDSPSHEVLYYVAEANCFGHGVEKNLEKGISLLNESNELGSEKAANLLGTCYSRGFGVSQDYDKALQLFETAIDRGSKHAYGNLGVLYLRGLGVTKNSITAREHFVIGAKAGDPVAAYFAAKCFENGIGSIDGQHSQEQAVLWYLEAAKNGHPEALVWCREHELLPEGPKSVTF